MADLLEDLEVAFQQREIELPNTNTKLKVMPDEHLQMSAHQLTTKVPELRFQGAGWYRYKTRCILIVPVMGTSPRMTYLPFRQKINPSGLYDVYFYECRFDETIHSYANEIPIVQWE